MYTREFTVNVYTDKAVIMKIDPDDFGLDIDHEGYLVDECRVPRDIGVITKNLLTVIFLIFISAIMVHLEPQEAGIIPLFAIPAAIALLVSTFKGGNPMNW